MRSRVPFGVCLSFLLLVAGPAAAQTEEQAARALFREGLALYEARDYGGAIQKYREAYAHWKNPKILANIGTAAWDLGRYVEAASAYDHFLADVGPQDPERAGVEKALRDVLPKVGTLNVVVTGGTAAVSVDGAYVEANILDRLRVEPGEHAIDAVGAGGVHARETVIASTGATVTVTLALGAAPQSSLPPEPKTSRSAGGAGSSRGMPVLPLVIGGVGLASLATSGVLFAMKGSAVSELQARCIGDVCPSSSGDTIDRANTLGTVGAITLGIGLAGVGTAMVLLVGHRGDHPSPSAARVDVGFAASPRGGQAVARFPF